MFTMFDPLSSHLLAAKYHHDSPSNTDFLEIHNPILPQYQSISLNKNLRIRVHYISPISLAIFLGGKNGDPGRDQKWRTSGPEWCREQGVELIFGRATKIDRSGKVVEVDCNGQAGGIFGSQILGTN
jgi:hypothetical protein